MGRAPKRNATWPAACARAGVDARILRGEGGPRGPQAGWGGAARVRGVHCPTSSHLDCLRDCAVSEVFKWEDVEHRGQIPPPQCACARHRGANTRCVKHSGLIPAAALRMATEPRGRQRCVKLSGIISAASMRMGTAPRDPHKVRKTQRDNSRCRDAHGHGAAGAGKVRKTQRDNFRCLNANGHGAAGPTQGA